MRDHKVILDSGRRPQPRFDTFMGLIYEIQNESVAIKRLPDFQRSWRMIDSKRFRIVGTSRCLAANYIYHWLSNHARGRIEFLIFNKLSFQLGVYGSFPPVYLRISDANS